MRIDPPPPARGDLVDVSVLFPVDSVRVAHIDRHPEEAQAVVNDEGAAVLGFDLDGDLVRRPHVLTVFDVARGEVLPDNGATEGVDGGDDDCVVHGGAEAVAVDIFEVARSEGGGAGGEIERYSGLKARYLMNCMVASWEGWLVVYLI